MPWTISGGTGANVTLPYGPNKVRITNPAKIDNFTQEGALPIVIVDGADNYTLTLDGTFYDKTKTASQNWTEIALLIGKRGSQIYLITPEGDLDGSYVMASFEPSRDRLLGRWSYSMKLVKGGSYVIL